MICFQSTPTSVGRSLSLWIRSCSDQNCSRRATVRLGIDTLIANILVIQNFTVKSDVSADAGPFVLVSVS